MFHNTSTVEFPPEWGDNSQLQAAISQHSAIIAVQTGHLAHHPAMPVTSGFGAISELHSAPTRGVPPHRVASHSRPIKQFLDVYPPPMYSTRAAPPIFREYISDNRQHNHPFRSPSPGNSFETASIIRRAANQLLQITSRSIRRFNNIFTDNRESEIIQNSESYVLYSTAPNGVTTFNIMNEDNLLHSGSTALDTDADMFNFANILSLSFHSETPFEPPPPYDLRRRPSIAAFTEAYVTRL